MKTSLVVMLALGSALASGCSSNVTVADAPAPAAAPAQPALLSDDVSVDEVAVYQGVKTTLVRDGAALPLAKVNAPIIAGRPAYVRVFAKAIGRARPTLEGELRIKRAGKDDLVLKDAGKRVVPELDDSLLENTLNFEIAAEDMTADASFSVRVSKKLDGATPDDVVAFPADGTTAPFNAKTASQKLKVKFVPISYEADAGTSLTPDLADLKSLQDTLYKMYPVASVEVSVRAPFKWASVVKANGPGWDELLSGIMQLRRVDQVERDVYYVGVFTPAASLDQFCNQGGCILGIAPQADELNVSMRAALVLGYKSRSAGGTLAQELAHAMGRMHAPCGGPQAVDPDFPYGSGSIGVWGYDLLEKTLIDPGNRYRDFMSYCGPVWTSDYTFQGIYERMEIVAKQQAAIAAANGGATPAGTPGAAQAAPIELRPSFRVAADGTVQAGPELEVIASGPRTSRGEQLDVTYEAASGKALTTVKGSVHRISGTGGSIVVAPKAPVGASRARLHGLGAAELRVLVPPK